MMVNVTLNSGEITGIEVVSHHESDPVFNRALPVLEERILEAQSPIVNSVSGATMSSYGIKSAVAEAMKQAGGQDFGAINVNTAPEHAQPQQLEDVSTDLVIVGGGPAGLATAITAKQSGVENVILVEKMDILGGNGKFNMNFTDLYHSQAKVEAGTDMTKEQFLEAKSAIDSETRMNRWADVAYDLDAWLRDLGIELNYTYDTYSHMAEADKYAGDYLVTILEELATALGVDYAGLQATIDAYNAQEDIERPFDAEGPYYGAAVQRAIHMTRGGVLANENSEVLDNDNQVVPGLYAAGEVCATSAQFSGSIVFGQIAATEAAEYISAQ